MRFALRFLFEETGSAWPKEPDCFWGFGGDAPHLTTLQLPLSLRRKRQLSFGCSSAFCITKKNYL